MSEIRYEEEEFEGYFNGSTLLRIVAQLRPYVWRVVAFVLAVAVVSFLETYFTYLNKQIVDEGIIAKNPDRLRELVILYGGLMVFQAANVFLFIYVTGILGQRVQYDLRKRLFNHIQTLSLSYFSKTPVGWMMSRVTSDTERISELLTWGLLDTVWAIMNVGSAVIIMMLINWQLAIVVALLVPALYVVAWWFKKRILEQYRLSRKTNSRITATYNENITGVRVVKALNREERNLDEFMKLTDDMHNYSYRAAWYSALFLPSVQLLSAFAVGAVVIYSGAAVPTGGMTIGDIQLFIMNIIFMIWPIQEMARVYSEMQHAIASAERTFSLMDTPAEIVNRPHAITVDSIAGDIEFENVNFYYEKESPVLTNFNLRVKRGETIALVGPTGGGKSTIVNLICRFYEPKEGVIRINGRDYTDYTLESIQSRIGVVLQTPHLFSGTIRENIRYGRLDATDAEVEEAAKIAGADEFIRAFEKGYDEEVGEGGVLLSVGQKQLVSLARAILSRPEIFVMDEATSSVDTLTEDLIQRGMERVLEGRTSFIIAHRLSTIKKADRIIVIEGGRIKEMGSHAELIRQRGHYYNLYTKQFRREKEVELGLADYDTPFVAATNGAQS